MSGGAAACTALDTKVWAAVDGEVAPGPAAIVIRPERIALLGADDAGAGGQNVMRGIVRDIVYLGASTQVHVDVGGADGAQVEVANHDGPGSVPYPPGATVQCVCTPDAVRVLRRSAARR